MEQKQYNSRTPFIPVNIPHEILEDLKAVSINHWETEYLPKVSTLRVHNLYINPPTQLAPYQNLLKFLKEDCGLRPKSIILFPTKPNSLKDPHRDGPREAYSYCGLNIPIRDAEASTMVWWPEFPEERVVNYALSKPDGSKSIGFDIVPIFSPSEFDDVSPDNRLILAHPHLVNTNIIHGVDSRNNSNYRLILSVRFFDNPKIDEVYNTIKQHYSEVDAFE
jgi:hypothetical protein